MTTKDGLKDGKVLTTIREGDLLHIGARENALRDTIAACPGNWQSLQALDKHNELMEGVAVDGFLKQV